MSPSSFQEAPKRSGVKRSEIVFRETRPYRAGRSEGEGEGVMASAVRKRKQSGYRRKSYSIKQQEQAWDEFKSAYEKKKN
jgi:hypothetical protein